MRISSVLLASSLLLAPRIAIAEPVFICYLEDSTGQAQKLGLLCSSMGQTEPAPASTATTNETVTLPPMPFTLFPASSAPNNSPRFRVANGRPTSSAFLSGKSYSCNSFKNMAEAQEILTHDPQNDPFNLDPDRNMIACEGTYYVPSRSTATSKIVR